VPTAVRLIVRSKEYEDAGVGIAISRRPFILLVPDHVLTVMEQGADTILVDDQEFPDARRLPAPALAEDHLALLQLGGKALKNVAPARLPRSPVDLTIGRPIRMISVGSTSRFGTVAEIQMHGEQWSVVTDVDVRPGESGSALMVGDELAGVCQGRVTTDQGGRAVAVPLSCDALRELRTVRNRRGVRTLTVLTSLLLIAALGFGAIAVRSSTTFALAGVEVEEGSSTITARNGQVLTFRSSWSRAFETRIRRFEMISPEVGGEPSHVAVGTIPEDGTNGAFILLDELGAELWRYSVPDGECIYQSSSKTYDLYLVDLIYCEDPDADGENELLVVFVHDHHEPCKLVVFEFSGEIIAEYWHPGYIRTMAVGSVGDPASPPLVVVSSSNNAIKTSWWNPQTLFAFDGLNISGQAPPYEGASGPPAALAEGTEVWYRILHNIDPERLRALIYKIDIDDYSGDGRNEIRAATSDGRFYYVNEHGDTLWVERADRWYQEFDDATPPPPLTVFPLRQPWPSAI